MKKLLMALPLLILMMTFVFASGDFSLRSSATETKQVNINSNGLTGNGYLIDASGYSRITYSFEQKQGQWMSRTQIGRLRGSWVPVTIIYSDNVVTFPELGLSAGVVNFK